MNLSDVYFELLRSALGRTAISRDVQDSIKPEVLPKLFKLSKMHDTTHLVAKSLNDNGLLEEGSEAKKRFLKELNLAIYRVEQLDFEISSLSEVLEQAKIPFILLKGSIIRNYYPEKWMRTSCDIDVIAKEQDLKKVVEALTAKLGYTIEDRDSHEITLISQSGVSIEVHFELLESRLPKAIKILKDIWKYVKVKDGKEYQHEFTTDMFYFYHIVHMAKHFVVGGCGVRPFMDIWVLKQFSPFDLREADKLLKEADLFTFTERAEELANVWFSNAESSPQMKKLASFILNGGAYGSFENGVAVRQVRKGGKFKYYMSRIFVFNEELSGKFPVLKKHRWLNPVFQVVRWFQMLFGGRMNRTVKEIKASGKLTKEQIKETTELIEYIGLK